MIRPLHRQILKADKAGLTTAEISDASDLAKRTVRRWKGRKLRDDYQRTAGDSQRAKQLAQAVDLKSDVSDRIHRGEDIRPPSDWEDSPDINGSTAQTNFDVDRAIEEQARRFRDKHRRAQKKRQQTIRFDTGPICIVFLGDQHIGNAGCDIKRVFDEQRKVLQMPRTYCWQMGDLVDNFIVGRLKEQNMKPSAPVWEQWMTAKKYLDKWWGHQKIVAYVGGNHGAWTAKTSGGIDYRRDVCPDGILFDGDDIKATVSVGSAKYKVWARHKWKGSSIYNQTHGQERAARFSDPNYDLYVGAHTHVGALYREMVHEGKRKAAVQVGTYKVHDDYQRMAGFPEHDHSTACAVILHDDGSMHGMADLDAAKRYMTAIAQ